MYNMLHTLRQAQGDKEPVSLEMLARLSLPKPHHTFGYAAIKKTIACKNIGDGL
jgi:hypothetical protein